MKTNPLHPPLEGEPRASAYGAESITVLSGLEAVRKNPSMYIGSTSVEGLHHLVYETVDNAIDESLAGHCSHIRVVLERDASCTVEDDGRGIPVEPHPELERPACEVALTTLHAGGKFREGSYLVSTGIHGVGISCVNALSAWLEIEIHRGGFVHRQRFEQGEPVGDLQRGEATDRSGTRIRFLPDPEIFEEITAFSFETLARRLQELAFLHPGVSIQIEDRRQGRVVFYQYDSGILGFLEHLNQSREVLHPHPIHMSDRVEGVEVELAMQWTTAYAEDISTFVNSINTIYGGTHLTGLKKALTRTINRYAARAGMINADQGEKITTFDILEGLTCVLSVKMRSPRFEGQVKTRLSSKELVDIVDGVVSRGLEQVLEQDSRLALQVVGRAIEASRARTAARRASNRARFQSIDTRISDEVYKKQFGIRSRNWHESAEWIANDELLSQHARLCDVEPDALMLDVCCGSGVVGAAFDGLVGRRVGLDITPEMVKLARERLDEVHQGNVYDLPFEDETFDIVVNREVLHLLPGPARPVAEIARVLKPGGQFIVGQILPYGPQDAAWMFRIFKKKQPLIFNMFQEQDFRELLLGAGFKRLHMEEYLLWELIDRWIDTHETTNLHRHEIRDLFYNAPQEARDVHPFEILPSGEIRDLWRWCVFSCFKPA